MTRDNCAQVSIKKAIIKYATIAQPDEVYKGKRRYHFVKGDRKKVYIISEGDFFLRARGFNKVVNVFWEDSIVGASSCLGHSSLYLERVDYGRCYEIEFNYFWELIKNKNLEGEVKTVIDDCYSDLMNAYLRGSKNTRREIEQNIKYWQSLPERITRGHSLLHLLELSTNLSKSTISRTLKDLKNEQGIILVNGRMKEDNELQTEL